MSVDTISIVGGGWSVKTVNLAMIPGRRIGVNDSAVHVNCDIVVSMDRLWTENRFDDLCRKAKPAWLRRSAVQNVSARPSWMRIFDCDHKSIEFSDEPHILNGTNSGFCAFNLAYQMRPKRIVLFGFDMNRSPQGEVYWYAPYPWAGGTSGGKYTAWAAQFQSAASKCEAVGIEVVNASPSSAIKVFRKTAEFMKSKERACVL